jgi:vitamin K-dependent gamma-carboxylase
MQKRFFAPVDNSALIVFRMLFGFLVVCESWGAILTGWVKNAFITPQHTFAFIDFPWLKPLPGDGMYAYFIVMGMMGLGIMLGYRYRLAAWGFALMWAGVYFMQKTNYNNHYYLMVLMSVMMAVVPAHRDYSLDARRDPALRATTCPQWCLWLFILQIGMVYTYAGIAKLHADWLMARPVSIWFDAKAGYPVVGPLLAQEWFRYFVAWGGAGFDLLIFPALLWRKTRPFAFAVCVCFHLFNSAVFQVGIFPYMGIGFCLFFFPPSALQKLFLKRRAQRHIPIPSENNARRPGWVMALFFIWMLVQVVLPLRNLAFPGNVNWTEEGHRMSWRMMLRAKSGQVEFRVEDVATGEHWRVSPYRYLTPKQVVAVATRPDMCWQFVQILKKEYQAEGREVRIFAQGQASLNGRPFQPLYHPEADLASVEWSRWKPAEWIVPLLETD